MEWIIFGAVALVFFTIFVASFVALTFIKRRRRAALFTGEIKISR